MDFSSCGFIFRTPWVATFFCEFYGSASAEVVGHRTT
jgi:hypothetical protein